ncbi:MAG: 50S ribosomal protein L4 [Candidatus Omnitrophota bacterium]
MYKIPVYNQQGKQLREIELDPTVFDGKVSQGALYQAVLMYRANHRMGLASTKTRGEVSGGGIKPWRQKGTGRARVGSIRSPLWRKGGVVFGPHPRDYNQKLPKKIKINALKSSINAKLGENNVCIVDDLKIDTPKTKEAIKVLSALKLGTKSILLMLEQINKDLKLSFQNIHFLDIAKASDTNAYDILKTQKLVITLGALEVLIKRLRAQAK